MHITVSYTRYLSSNKLCQGKHGGTFSLLFVSLLFYVLDLEFPQKARESHAWSWIRCWITKEVVEISARWGLACGLLIVSYVPFRTRQWLQAVSFPCFSAF